MTQRRSKNRSDSIACICVDMLHTSRQFHYRTAFCYQWFSEIFARFRDIPVGMTNIMNYNLAYREKVENEFSCMNTKQAFNCALEKDVRSFGQIICPFNFNDPLKFASDLNSTQTIIEHMKTAGDYARILFIDFSSAFNTIQRHVKIDKLQKLQFQPRLFTGFSIS